MSDLIRVDFDLSRLTGTDLEYSLKAVSRMHAYARRDGETTAAQFFFELLVVLTSVALREPGSSPALRWLANHISEHELIH